MVSAWGRRRPVWLLFGAPAAPGAGCLLECAQRAGCARWSVGTLLWSALVCLRRACRRPVCFRREVWDAAFLWRAWLVACRVLSASGVSGLRLLACAAEWDVGEPVVLAACVVESSVLVRRAPILPSVVHAAAVLVVRSRASLAVERHAGLRGGRRRSGVRRGPCRCGEWLGPAWPACVGPRGGLGCSESELAGRCEGGRGGVGVRGRDERVLDGCEPRPRIVWRFVGWLKARARVAVGVVPR